MCYRIAVYLLITSLALYFTHSKIVDVANQNYFLATTIYLVQATRNTFQPVVDA